MNSIHNNGENDSSLNDGLDKLGRVYGQLEQDEPPELLDQAILNSAHRAVEKKPHWMKFSWLHGLTTAAVFVLAFSIILNQREPAPVFENGMRNLEPVRLQREKSAKKPSVVQPSELRKEIKVSSDIRQDELQSMPAAAAAESEALDDSPEVSTVRAQRSLYVRDSLQGKTESDDKDFATGEFMLEEVHMDEAEQRLLAIIKLKQSGDETWKTELESFKEAYPDYPLPKELRN